MAEFQESLRTVSRDLFSLEINTVIKDTMTARKMPDAANALLDIAQTYATKLLELHIPLGAAFAEEDPDLRNPLAAWPKQEFDYDRLAISADTFGRLRWASVAGQVGLRALEADDRIVLVRIDRNCEQLVSLILRIEDGLKVAGIHGANRHGLNKKLVSTRSRSLLRLEPDDFTLVRKIWEVGVEKVVMQTVIQLDGDVITRISRRYAAPDLGHLFEIHQKSVEMSVRFWGLIANTVAVFLGSFAGLLGASKNPAKIARAVVSATERP
jgi:hypothetical protein